MSKRPPVHELEFLKVAKNHREFGRSLTSIGVNAADVLEYAQHVCDCWFSLAEEHLADAEEAFKAKRKRSTYSRSYYSAYNASKAARYFVSGTVSLNSDDHKYASSNLPGDIPDVAEWARRITMLYEHRLRADYDNWHDVDGKNSLTPEEAVTTAREFLDAVRTYIKGKYGSGDDRE